MFGSLAHLMYRRRWYVLGVWLVVLGIALSQASQARPPDPPLPRRLHASAQMAGSG